MKALTTFVSAAALALGIASASHAAVIAQFLPDSGSSDYKWIQSGTGGSFISINGGADTSAQGVATHFSFLDAAHSALAFLPATFTIDASVAPGHPATEGTAAEGFTYTQTNVDGAFSFIYNGPTQDIDGYHLVAGMNLLSGTFTDAWIQGAGHSGSTNLTIGNGGTLSFTSDFLSFSHPETSEFAFNLLGVSPNFSSTGCAPGAGPCTGTSSLGSFTANGGGNFSTNGVPEPATWGMMIVGFGGIGMAMRNRRRPALAKA